jgi:hypothetical protein
MYPDDKCHHHKKQVQRTANENEDEEKDGEAMEIDPPIPAPVEDTKHMLNCEARESRKQAAIAVWNNIRQMIRESQGENAPSTEYLKPFALRDANIVSRPVSPPPARGGARFQHHTDPFVNLRAVGDFPDSDAELALIPKELEGALRELELEEDRASALADEIVVIVQEAVAR